MEITPPTKINFFFRFGPRFSGKLAIVRCLACETRSENERGAARTIERRREGRKRTKNELRYRGMNSKTKEKPNNRVFPFRGCCDGGNNGRPGIRLWSEVEENWIRNRIYSILFARDDENLNSSDGGLPLSLVLFSLSLSFSVGRDVSPSVSISRTIFYIFDVWSRFRGDENRQETAVPPASVL